MDILIPQDFQLLAKLNKLIEKELTKIYKKHFESMASPSAPSLASQHTITKANNIGKTWEAFLKSTNKELQQETSTSSSIHVKFKRYRNLATKLYV